MKKTGFIMVIFLFMGLTSCKEEFLPESTELTNELFFREMFSNNRVKILAAEMALQRSTNQDVISFSNNLLTYHSDLENKIIALAASKGIAINRILLSYHQNNYNTLGNYSDNEFNRQFAFLILLTQTEAIEILTEASDANNNIDESLKLWALDQLPDLRLRYDEADLLSAKLK